jgi:hypothetical protein
VPAWPCCWPLTIRNVFAPSPCTRASPPVLPTHQPAPSRPCSGKAPRPHRSRRLQRMHDYPPYWSFTVHLIMWSHQVTVRKRPCAGGERVAAKAGKPRTVQRGARYAATVTDYRAPRENCCDAMRSQPAWPRLEWWRCRPCLQRPERPGCLTHDLGFCGKAICAGKALEKKPVSGRFRQAITGWYS